MTGNDVQRQHGVPASAAGDGRTVETTAAHVGTTLGNTRAAFRRYVERVPELHHLAHYTQCDWDFSVGPKENAEFDTIGCNLVAALTRVSHLLAPVGTGALIRAVAHARRGALVCNTIMQGENVVGVALDPRSEQSPRDEATRRADIGVAELVTELRESFGQRGQNPGGYDSAKIADPFVWSPPDVASLDLLERIHAVLDPGDLQFVALVHDGAIRNALDVFDDPAAEVFFRAGYTPSLRRDFYRRFVTDLDQHARDIGRIANGVIGRGMRRIVLDVQRGAIYYYRMDLESYLVGITLNQDQVVLADLKMEWLSRPQPQESP